MKGKEHICRYCKRDISDLHHNRTVCLRQECQERFLAEKKERAREVQQAYTEKHRRNRSEAPIPSVKSKKWPVCRFCGRPIRDGNQFFHKHCLSTELRNSNTRIDGDWIYA